MTHSKKPVLAMTDSDRLRFYSKIRENPVTGCYEWVAAKNTSGYGIFRLGCYQPMVASHRVAYMLHHKIELPRYVEGDPTLVLHTCDNRICCNPSHLWLGTRDDNAKDAAKKGRIVSKGVPPIGVGEKNGRSKITESAVALIRQTFKEHGADAYVVAFLIEKTGLSRGSIFDVILRRSWKHVA